MCGWPGMATNSRKRRDRLKAKSLYSQSRKCRRSRCAAALLACFLITLADAQAPGPVRISLGEAIQLALQHNHNILAARTTIQQSQAAETTANLRPNPSLFSDWEYLPLGSPSHQNPAVYQDVPLNDYLNNNTE